MSSFALLFATTEDRAEAVKAIQDYTILVECRCGRYRRVQVTCPVCGSTKEREDREKREKPPEAREEVTIEVI